MCSRAEACEAARLIVEIAKPVRGGHKSYTPGHVLEALDLFSRAPTGRPQLSRALGLGEASTKTLITILENRGLVERTSRGRVLTPRGSQILETVRQAIRLAQLQESFFNDPEGDVAALVTVLPPATSLLEVYAYRDYLVEYRCRTALIGGIRGGRITVPGAPRSVAEKLESSLSSLPDGLLIVVPSRCRRALLSAVLSILAEKTMN